MKGVSGELLSKMDKSHCGLPSGREMMKSWISASLQAWWMPSLETLLLSTPRRTFSRTVPENPVGLESGDVAMIANTFKKSWLL